MFRARNNNGQLGHGDETDINTPKIIKTLKNIQQISHGSCGAIFSPKTLKTKYLPLEITNSDNSEETITSNSQRNKPTIFNNMGK